MRKLKQNSTLRNLFTSTMTSIAFCSSTVALAATLGNDERSGPLPIPGTVRQETATVPQFYVHLTNCCNMVGSSLHRQRVRMMPIDTQDTQAQQQPQDRETNQPEPLPPTARPEDLPKAPDPEPEPYANVPGPTVPPSVQPSPKQPGLAPPPMPEPAAPHLAPSPPPMPQPAEPPPLSQRPELNPADPGALGQQPVPPSPPAVKTPEPTAYKHSE